MRQGVLIQTTEHLLSVFYSMRIDNAFIDIDTFYFYISNFDAPGIRLFIKNSLNIRIEFIAFR